MKQIIFLISLVASLNAFSAAPDGKTTLRIVLAGDSTVTDQAGWGGAFPGAFKEGVEVINLARGGRSSKSFRTEGIWEQALAKKPDYIFIQFGHNDCPGKGPERETKPEGEYRENLRRYVAEARAIGAVPVLVSPMTRRRFDSAGRIVSILTPYASATRSVAKETNAPLIDLHPKSVALCEKLGTVKSDELGPKGDRTHFNKKGAKVIVDLILEDLRIAVLEMKRWLR